MATEKRYIPNSFQMPNAFVDEFAYLLTSDEFKILTFITRRILGFHSSRDIRRNKISLSQIQKEIISKKDGARIVSYGVGLSRPTIIKCLDALENYNFIFKVGSATQKGQEYELNTGIEPIKKEELLARKSEKLTKGKDRFDKIKKSKQKKQLMGLTSDQEKTIEVVNGIDHQVVNPINQANFNDKDNNSNEIGQENCTNQVVNGINTLKLTKEINIETKLFAPLGASATIVADENKNLNSPKVENKTSSLPSVDVNNLGADNQKKFKKSTADERRKLLEWWNGLGIIAHKSEPKSGRTTLQSALDGILRNGETLRDVCKTIQNYKEILDHPKTHFTYKWGLTDFLVRGYSKFSDQGAALHNYVTSGLNNSNHNHNGNVDSRRYNSEAYKPYRPEDQKGLIPNAVA